MLKKILQQLAPTHTKLIAVSKTHPPERVLELYHQGQRIFGENRVQELTAKYEALPKDIEWHLIGHLQTNKVKYIAPFVACIESVDSGKLLEEINKQAAKHERVIDCLLQFHVAEEETKFGLDEAEAAELLQSPDFQALKNVRITGVMGMATFTDNQVQVRREFRHLKQIFEDLKARFFQNQPSFKEISIGMSGDYEMAVEEGSTMVRVGTLLFGAR
ncbi:MAG: YggS family pyridoxal phosphate-dependent enzyme [Saprospiraceae bacterium]|nr:YggS family pyridoxal phosphate-dependent enzyme [Saprospiraceae bacterium]MCF8252057.1 YggS family pyridoxal phosphate-dependent enzyme [Saprospiraceae bacterium]MCF8281746.1 YggS family pyridoxal phosphate-dependent enzyme [Bacteroidales bacterium]MCF8310366.1 YggS family pyridoxal phosphate-dependent enzyme [Saprospiraceae bacterium]MCF8439744.1 YggS family pyridoxal phosphate-dependent enzyme [Saprospiraceae bacterium]